MSASQSTSKTSAPAKSAQKPKPKNPNHSALIDDDEFEEFAASDLAFKAQGEQLNEQVWDENWEDERGESEFIKEMQRILNEGGYVQKQQ